VGYLVFRHLSSEKIQIYSARPIESCRKILASRLRKASDDIIDGDFSEPAPVCGDTASGGNGEGRPKTADNDPDPGATNDPTRREIA
jgi:hypothetical protein